MILLILLQMSLNTTSKCLLLTSSLGSLTCDIANSNCVILSYAVGVVEADSVVLVVDGQSGLHPSDEEVLSWLRQHHPSKPVVLAVNKCESSTRGPTQVGPGVGWGGGVLKQFATTSDGT
jgi:hypothetical protein